MDLRIKEAAVGFLQDSDLQFQWKMKEINLRNEQDNEQWRDMKLKNEQTCKQWRDMNLRNEQTCKKLVEIIKFLKIDKGDLS